MTRTKTLLRALLGVGAAGAIAAFGTFSAFSSTTDNPNNQVSTGTVQLDNNGNGLTLINATGLKPNDPKDFCVRVVYTGTLEAKVRMYIPTAIGAIGDDIDLDVTPGTVTNGTTFPNCTGWASDPSGNVFGDGDGSGGLLTLDDFQQAHKTWASGLEHNPGTAWTQNEAQVYRFRVVVRDTAAQNTSTNTFAVKFEAQNT